MTRPSSRSNHTNHNTAAQACVYVSLAPNVDDEKRRSEVGRLARELSLPLVDNIDPPAGGFLLTVCTDHLELRDVNDTAERGIYVDWIQEFRVRIRGRQSALRQPLARAVGLNRSKPTVVDATAGFGRDAFQLVLWGCHVTAVERSPVMAALLQDGLRRAKTVPGINELIADRFRLVTAEAQEYLHGIPESSCPDVIYLDPMYLPKTKTSALARKDMRYLRALVGHDSDAVSLFDIARTAARSRVVVKRWPHSPSIAPNPTFTVSGKIARFDVYVTRIAEKCR